MGKKKKRRRRSRRRSSSLKEHKRVRKKLVPPLAQLPNLAPMNWNPDVLPEMLLIDAAIDQLTWSAAPGALHRSLDELDRFMPENAGDVILGTITSMSLIPEDRRDEARAMLADGGLFEILVPEGLRHGLALYPQCPAGWLISDWRKDHSADWERGVGYLKRAVRRLWESQSVYSTRCRMVSLARMIKHGRVSFSPDIKSIQLYPRYPDGLTLDEQQLVESTSRAMFSGVYGSSLEGQSHTWAAYFWRHNYDISLCERPDDFAGGELAGEELMRQVLARIGTSVEGVQQLIEQATSQARMDIYELDRDEVIFGLVSRQFRLFRALAEHPSLWVADLGSMFHRVMVEALICLKWLIERNDFQMFRRFKDFSLGRLKLLKLHVEEMVDRGREDLAETAEYLAESINEDVWEEFVSIDLGGSFSGVNTRKMAQEVGLEDVYKLAFSPASAELHGEWSSLKRFYLERCLNPLHRFHRLPKLVSPSVLAPGVVLLAGWVLSETIGLQLEAYDLHRFQPEVKSFLRRLEDALSGL